MNDIDEQLIAKITEQVNRRIETAEDERDINIARCILLFVLARFMTEPNPERLADESGFPKDFVERVVGRMKVAGLWAMNVIVTRHWFDENGLSPEIFGHALVGIGEA